MADFGDIAQGLFKGLAYMSPEEQNKRALKAKYDAEGDMEMKKMQLAKQLEMQVWQMKEEYAQQHPEYVHFAKTPEGITGFTKYGTAAQVYKNTPEEKALQDRKDQMGLDAQQALIDQRKASAAAAMENAETNKSYRGLLGAAATTRANRPTNAAKYDESAIYKRNLEAAMKEVMPPKPGRFDFDAQEGYAVAVQQAQAKAMELANQRTQEQLARLRGQQQGGGLLSPPANDFMNLLNKQSAPQPYEEEDDELSPADQ